MARLIAYLVGVGAIGMIAQGAIGGALHDVVWSTHMRGAIRGDTRIVTETAPGRTVTIRGETVTRPAALGRNPIAPATTAVTTVPAPATTTVHEPAVTTTVLSNTETVQVSGPTVTTTVPGPTVTTTVPGPPVTTTVPGPARTTTVLGPTVTTTTPGPTVTTTIPGPTETVTVTVTESCDPAPKKPSNPPCPPHK